LAEKFDAVVAGGSIAGLAFACEAARRGISVLVAEEHGEIGEPEKCDGLVSLRGLNRYGFTPERNVIQNRIASGVVHSPGGRPLAVSAVSLDVVVLDRSEYDKQVARNAQGWGAEVRTGVRATLTGVSGSSVEARVGSTTVSAKYYVDATGPATSQRDYIVPAAKYEVEGDWIKESVVEVFLDSEKYPGFFAWVIPYGQGLAKVGAAGRGINAGRALDDFLSGRKHRVLRRVAAPLFVGGPASEFVAGGAVRVGESAGQVKPTTAGGIMTSIAGAVIAARWVSDAVQLGRPELVSNYQPDWEARFLKEMKAMLRLRRVFELLTNSDLDALVSAVSSSKVAAKLADTDFDFHATALLGALGMAGLFRVAKVVASAEAKAVLMGR
jgi:digeranylgeranylglycerophospholipid reductase